MRLPITEVHLKLFLLIKKLYTFVATSIWFQMDAFYFWISFSSNFFYFEIKLKIVSRCCQDNVMHIIIIIMFYSKPFSKMFYSNSYITTLLWFVAWPLWSQPKYNHTWRKLQRLTKWAAQESEEEMMATVIGVAGKIKFQFIT